MRALLALLEAMARKKLTKFDRLARIWPKRATDAYAITAVHALADIVTDIVMFWLLYVFFVSTFGKSTHAHSDTVAQRCSIGVHSK